MAANQLFYKLSKPEIIKIGWHLAQGDSRDDFVRDPVSHTDYAFNLSTRLAFLIEQIRSHRYRPRYLIEVDVPKSDLSVRPGNVLPIEEASVLHAAIYLLAPKLDGKLNESVYSYRLHPEWRKRARRGESLFREVSIEIPFLKTKTIHSISPFETWYERWPAFEDDAKEVYQAKKYTHLAKTDIFSFFEHIDLGILQDLLRSLIATEEEHLIQLIFTILNGWTRPSSTGMRINRGIPQGNDVSSFLANIFLIPLDRVLINFCRKHDACWFRYVDDVKVYTRSWQDARQVIFEINNALRKMHLNLQGGKTRILSGKALEEEHENSKMEKVNEVFCRIGEMSSIASANKEITKEIKKISIYLRRYTRRMPSSFANMTNKENRLFRRILTTYGVAKRTHKGLNNAVYVAMQELPDPRVLRSCLGYLRKQDIKRHEITVNRLLCLIEEGKLLFPYQVSSVLDAISQLHPDNPKLIASRVRAYALGKRLEKRSNWMVVQKALEVIAAYPYKDMHVINICRHYTGHDDPMVRRAATMLFPRSPVSVARRHLGELSVHPDSDTSRLAQHLLYLHLNVKHAKTELVRFRRSDRSDNMLIRRMYLLYAMSLTENKVIAKDVYNTTSILDNSKSSNIIWHKNHIRSRTKWATK